MKLIIFIYFIIDSLNFKLEKFWLESDFGTKKIGMLAYKWLEPIQESQKLLNDKITRFELDKTPINKRRNELLTSLRPCLQGVLGTLFELEFKGRIF